MSLKMLDNGHNKEKLTKCAQIWLLSLKDIYLVLCLYPSHAVNILCQPCKTYYYLILSFDVASFFDNAMKSYLFDINTS